MNTFDIGKRGERSAKRALCQKGYRHLCSNYRHGRHEIDLVMLDGDYLVFIEVKARSGDGRFGTPAMAVGREKQRCLIRAAEYYMAENHCEDQPARFDVVEVYLDDEKIQHIVNAFFG